MSVMSVSVRVVLACAFVGGCALGCVSTPTMRPVGPPMGDHSVEAGVGPHAMFGRDSMAVGMTGWAAGQVHTNIDIVGHGYGTDFFAYDGSTPVGSDVLFGGGLGLRGRYMFFDSLVVGAEAFAAYDQRTGANNHEQLFLAMFGLPVAEEAFEGFWVYTDIQLGIAVPFQEDPRGPFFGIQEIPIGVVWEATPWLLLVGEGGYALPLNGGYGSVAAAFRF
jgi:hypothetical protein